MPVYEKRATLFLDLLGFRDLVDRRKEKPILQAISMLPAAAVQYEDAWSDVDFQFSAFSDCIVCSTKIFARNNFMPAAILASCAGQLALHMLSNGILTRGAITVGELYHRDGIVFGPSMIEAYQMEATIARYPRIVAPDKIQGRINMSLSIVRGVDWWLKHQPFRRDFDGVYHLDVFGPYFLEERPASLRKKNSSGTLEELGPVTARLIRKVCKTRHKNKSISIKYDWLESYLEDCIVRFGWQPLQFGNVAGRAARVLRDLTYGTGAKQPR